METQDDRAQRATDLHDKLRRATNLSEILRSIDEITDPLTRAALREAQISYAIEKIREDIESRSQKRFTPEQIELLQGVAFHIIYILDPAYKPRRSIWERARTVFKRETWGNRLMIMVTAAITVAAVSDLAKSLVEHIVRIAK